MAAQHMGERIHEPALAVGEAQDAADIGLRELIEKRVVDRFAVAGVFEYPSDPVSIAGKS